MSIDSPMTMDTSMYSIDSVREPAIQWIYHSCLNISWKSEWTCQFSVSFSMASACIFNIYIPKSEKFLVQLNHSSSVSIWITHIHKIIAISHGFSVFFHRIKSWMALSSSGISRSGASNPPPRNEALDEAPKILGGSGGGWPWGPWWC